MRSVRGTTQRYMLLRGVRIALLKHHLSTRPVNVLLLSSEIWSTISDYSCDKDLIYFGKFSAHLDFSWQDLHIKYHLRISKKQSPVPIRLIRMQKERTPCQTEKKAMAECSLSRTDGIHRAAPEAEYLTTHLIEGAHRLLKPHAKALCIGNITQLKSNMPDIIILHKTITHLQVFKFLKSYFR